jgi:hypothetical protein
MVLMSLTLDKSIPTVADLLASRLAKYITLAPNDCRYSSTAKELIVTYVYPLFLEAHSAASKADNPSWHEAARVKFLDEYLKAMKLEIATLETVDAWSVIDRLDHHVIAKKYGLSNANIIQIYISRSSKCDSVQEVINSSKELISSKHIHQSSNGQQLD